MLPLHPGRCGRRIQDIPRAADTALYRQAVWKDVKRAAAALRLTANAAPHSARKVYAVELLRKYGDIDRVRRALNHGGLEVTLIYAMADKQLTAAGRRRRGKPGRKRA